MTADYDPGSSCLLALVGLGGPGLPMPRWGDPSTRSCCCCGVVRRVLAVLPELCRAVRGGPNCVAAARRTACALGHTSV